MPAASPQAGTQPARKGCSGFCSFSSQALAPGFVRRANIVRFCPCRQPLSGLFILGGAARIPSGGPQSRYRRLRQPPMLRYWMFQRYAFFLCPSAEKRDRCLVLNIIGIVCRAASCYSVRNDYYALIPPFPRKRSFQSAKLPEKA